MPGWLTLIGSGETAAGMVKVHRVLLKGLADPPHPTLIDTPAGFELGLQAIHSRFLEFFRKRLGLTLEIASYRGQHEEPASVAQALAAITSANYILAGPGSPTYAARQWRGSPVFEAVSQRWLAGAQLVFASSAAIAISRHVLPVYEIYKVGQDLGWTDGLDLLGPFGFELAIVSHWDNAEGGTHDTRACFMGLERFERLRAQLPSTTVVLGIDEHTACTLDLERGTGRVMGRGGVTLLRGPQTLRHTAGQTFLLDELAPSVGAQHAMSLPATAEAPLAPARASHLIAAGDLAGGLRLAAANAPPDLAVLLHQAAQSIESAPDTTTPTEALIQLLVETRAEMRRTQQWALADWLRDRLAELGVTLQDTPQGTVWTRSR
ncbi:MAG: hypothetical protein AB1449_13205 [Chloroflexota bacterium]